MKLFEAQHHAEAHFVMGLLQTAGIAAEVRGDSLFTTVGCGPTIPGMCPIVWILEDPQQEQAQNILASYTTGEGITNYSDGPWKCQHCGEIHEPQFASCWNCGTENNRT